MLIYCGMSTHSRVNAIVIGVNIYQIAPFCLEVVLQSFNSSTVLKSSGVGIKIAGVSIVRLHVFSFSTASRCCRAVQWGGKTVKPYRGHVLQEGPKLDNLVCLRFPRSSELWNFKFGEQKSGQQ